LLVILNSIIKEQRAKIVPLGVAVNLAQLPEVYQVPPLMMHPFCPPFITTLRKPLPDNTGEVDVEVGGVVELVTVGGVVPPGFGRYFTPDAAQLDPEPTGLADVNVPTCTDPWTLK
jgi:hypothetical protein